MLHGPKNEITWAKKQNYTVRKTGLHELQKNICYKRCLQKKTCNVDYNIE